MQQIENLPRTESSTNPDAGCCSLDSTIHETHSKRSQNQMASAPGNVNLPTVRIESDNSMNFGCIPANKQIGDEHSKLPIGQASGDFVQGLGQGMERLARKTLEPEPAVVKVAREHQLEADAMSINGKIVNRYYHVGPDGERNLVLKTDLPPERASEQIDQWKESKLKELEQTFNVRISREGETDVYGRGWPWSSYETRTPFAGEVATLEEALLRSVPDTETFSGKPLKITYLTHPVPEDGVEAFARGEEIVLSPNPSRSTLIHELAHIGQQEVSHDWVPGGFESETGSDNILREFADKMGWKASSNGWIIEDKEGNYWKAVKWPGEDWVRTDANGNPADSNGRRTDNPWNPFDHGEDTAQHRSGMEIMENAKVSPVSSYFPNPAEMWAEMASEFRNGEISRQEFYNRSVESYQLTKELDQRQINSEFGTRDDGQPNKIRLPNGIVVENTSENRTTVDTFERTISTH